MNISQGDGQPCLLKFPSKKTKFPGKGFHGGGGASNMVWVYILGCIFFPLDFSLMTWISPGEAAEANLKMMIHPKET